MDEQEFKEAAQSVYLNSFADRLSQRGYDFLTEDEESLTRAHQAVRSLRAGQEKQARQERPFRQALMDQVLDGLLDQQAE